MLNTIHYFYETYSSFWPAIVFIAMVLAGLNVPISEDLMIVLSAKICQEKASNNFTIITICALYSGIILSDLIAYFLGFLFSKGIRNFKWVQKVLESEKKDRILKHLEKKGMFTFITLRFIPFGVRNVLFLSSGFFRLRFSRFVLFDMIAAAVSSQTLFWATHFVGQEGSTTIRLIGAAILLVIAAIIAFHASTYLRKEKTD